ncbi:hypothetical protein LM602_06655 [Candidatus Acetothermia bacterium]|jgi:DNA-binding XRE family transcriptional regulator|nr:hypothetical protein [Candidatus Acetothermia bacterium]MCI2432214.1 hypothetical protein [Candidatus Acetothermia bacterium]MCI2436117.1 hypothetical protein [Candidatus Acetothermia bacterium]
MKPWYELEIKSVQDAIYILRRARVWKRDTAASLARYIGKSKWTIYLWEQGRYIKKPNLKVEQEDRLLEYVKEAQRNAKEFEEKRAAL